jgi:tetratricopeptide (TPR) repeat protein
LRAAAQKSIELDPLLAEAHAAMGFLYSREHAWAEADQSFRRAIALNPTLLHVYTSYSLTTLLPLGRFQEDERLLRAALERDPYSLEVKRELGLIYLTSGRYRESILLLEQIKAVNPTYEVLPLLLARAQSLAGRIDEAMPYWNSVSSQVGSQHWMAYAFVHAGRRDEIERLVAQPQVAYRQVLFYAALGDKDRAFDALSRAADEAPHRTVRLLQYPELADLRGDPRFNAIRAKFHLQ